MKVKAHLHLPKMKQGIDEVISVIPFGGTGAKYYGTVLLTNPVFRVSEAGRQRTLTTGVKNVHAWVIGDLVGKMAGQHKPRKTEWRQARYNPREVSTFVDTETNEPVLTARAAYLVGSKVFYV